jgi:hypothetical protein
MGTDQGGSLWCIGRDAEARPVSNAIVRDVVHNGTGVYLWF